MKADWQCRLAITLGMLVFLFVIKPALIDLKDEIQRLREQVSELQKKAGVEK